jgi:hypothetical protein
VGRMSTVDDEGVAVRIVNLTPHPVNIRVGDAEVELPAADVPARLSGRVEAGGSVRFDDLDIPVLVHRYTDVEGLPTEEEGVLHIVSQLVLDFVSWRRDLVTPAELVRDERGNVVGCRALARRFL